MVVARTMSTNRICIEPVARDLSRCAPELQALITAHPEITLPAFQQTYMKLKFCSLVASYLIENLISTE